MFIGVTLIEILMLIFYHQPLRGTTLSPAKRVMTEVSEKKVWFIKIVYQG